MAEIKLSWWDKLRGIIGYTLQVQTHTGWHNLHPNRDGSPYLRSKQHAEDRIEDVKVLHGTQYVRVAPVKRPKP